MEHACVPAKQQSTAAFNLEQTMRLTRRERCTAEMDKVMPWAKVEEWVAAKIIIFGQVALAR
jgi:hypothetical protein